jgi:hypothetical protein
MRRQAAITGEIDIDDLDVGVGKSNVILARQFAADAAIAALIVNGIDPDAGLLFWIIVQMERPEVPHQPRTQELANEAFISIVGPDVPQDTHDVAGASDVREPFAVLVIGIGHDPLDVPHHRKTEGIGIEAGIAGVFEVGLENHVGVGLEELQEVAVRNLPLFVQAIRVCPIGRL